jgi:hypothetical protein
MHHEQSIKVFSAENFGGKFKVLLFQHRTQLFEGGQRRQKSASPPRNRAIQHESTDYRDE